MKSRLSYNFTDFFWLTFFALAGLFKKKVCKVVTGTTFLLVACSTQADTVTLHFENPDGGKSPSINCEVKNSPAERQMGMMYRKELAERSGMLFVFPKEGPRAFWMKNTYVPLDIIYIDKAFTVVSIAKHAKPLSKTTLPSSRPAQYVIEINAGLSEQWGIKAGSKLLASNTIPAAKQ